MKVIVKLNVLKSVLLSAPKQDIRYYLNGVCFYSKNNIQYVVSSDGHRLLQVTISYEKMDDCEYIINRNEIDNLVKSKGLVFEFNFFMDDKTKKYSCDNSVMTVNGVCVDGRYPDVDRVIPLASLDHTYANINLDFDYLADALKQRKLLSKTSKFSNCVPFKSESMDDAAYYYGDNLEDYTNSFVIVVMPYRF